VKRLIVVLVLIIGVAAAGTPAFAQQSGNLRIEFQGPGGHSYGAYRRVSALHAAARAVILIQAALPAGSYQITNRELSQCDRVGRSHRTEVDRRKCRYV
jgi:hypothetical protein